MVNRREAAVATDMPAEVPQPRHEDPVEGRISIRKWFDLSSRLPGQIAAKSVNGLDTRRFIEAVLWIAATDSMWPQLPASYGNFHTVYQRFVRWTRLDVWDFVCAHLQGDARLPALQRLVQRQRELQQRRQVRAAQAAGKGGELAAGVAERLHALEARLEKMESALLGMLDAVPQDLDPAQDFHSHD